MRVTRTAGMVPVLLATAATTLGMALAVPASASPARPVPAAHTAARTFAAAAAKTFTVNTTDDSDLATSSGTTCSTAAGTCSLRAAVDAANNLATPVRIVLPKGDYTLSSATALTVTNPGGTSIAGAGASSTTITGAGSGLFDVTAVPKAAPGLLFVSGTTLTKGTATDGGAIYLDYDGTNDSGSGVVLDNDVITGNTATYGGGVYGSAYATIYAKDTTITGNTASTGAGIYQYWSDVQLIDTDITKNTTPSGSAGYGAGLYNEYGVVHITGGSISENTAGDATDIGYGGGVYDDYDLLIMNKVQLQHDTATYGGAIYATYDNADVTDGSLSDDRVTNATDANGNVTTASGGAIYIAYSSQFGLHHVTLAGDTVVSQPTGFNGGGAIFDYAYDYANQLTIDSGSRITGANAGAVYAYAYEGSADVEIDDSTLSGNTDDANNGYDGYGCGGALCGGADEYGSVALSMTGDQVTGNSSTGDVGSGAISMYSFDEAQSTTRISHSTFAHNNTGAGGYGGALSFYSAEKGSPQSIRLTSDRFSGNTAGTNATNGTGFGGAVSLYDYAALSDNGSTFEGNAVLGAGGSGGAVGDDSFGTSVFTGTDFTGNSAGKGKTAGYGGAVYTDDEGGDRFVGVTVAGNRAGSDGGGVYADSDAYALAFEDSTISGNVAGSAGTPGFGGGVYADDGVFTLDNSTVSGNAAEGTGGQGGGIWQDGSRLGLRYSTVSANTASSGGGVYTEGPGGSLLGSIVSGNLTAVRGAESDCAVASSASRLSSLGGNVIGQRACVAGAQSSDAVTPKPGLAALANNGGPTGTMRLTSSSPALNRSTQSCPATDQRGEPRPAKTCDAGAYQRAVASIRSLSPGKGRARQTVTITGSGFTFATKVSFGSKSAAFTIVSDTKIRATAPTGVKGSVAVTVTSRDGSGRKGKFRYTA